MGSLTLQSIFTFTFALHTRLSDDTTGTLTQFTMLSTLSVLALVLTGTLVTAHESDLRRRLGLFGGKSKEQELLEANAAKVSESLGSYLDPNNRNVDQLFDSFVEGEDFMTREQFEKLIYATLYVFIRWRSLNNKHRYAIVTTVDELKPLAKQLLSKHFSTYRAADKPIILREDFKAYGTYLDKQYD